MSAPWLSDWAKRLKLTIDSSKIDSDLTNFPLLITLTPDIYPYFFDGAGYPSVDDNFTGDDGDPVNPDLWAGTGSIYDNMVRPNTSISSMYTISGDFDIQVYWDKTTGPWVAAAFFYFNVMSTSNWFQLYREFTSERIVGTNGTTYNYDTRDWDTGYFRMLKSTTNIKLYFKRYAVDSWIQRSSFSCVNEEYTITLAKVNTCEPSFDNFIVNAGVISWAADEPNPNRKKMAITTGDGVTQCYTEIERRNAIYQEANLWVQAPAVASGTDTDLYLYYDSTQPDNTTYIGDLGDVAARLVWDDNFIAVYHMAQDPTGDVANAIKDSTSNLNHGTPEGSMTDADSVEGKIAKAIDFDGNDAITSTSSDFELTTITLEVIYKPTYLNPAHETILAKWNDGPSKGFRFLRLTSSKALNLVAADGSSSSNIAGGVLTEGVTYNVAATITPTAMEAFLNGSSVDQKDPALTMVYGSESFKIAKNVAEWFAVGEIDEVRVSDIARTTPWLKATYYSNWDDLLTYGSEETAFDPSASTNRIKLTIDHTKVSSILYNFPVLIAVSSNSGITNSDVTDVFTELASNDNRKKIAITTDDEVTKCSVEIERWDHVNREAFLWAKVPEISDSVDTILYLYYDVNQPNNTFYVGDTTEPAAQNVWDSDYSFVAHLSTRYESSTSISGISDSGDFVTSSIAKGVWLDSTNSEYLDCGTVISGSSYTFETFFKTSDIGDIILKNAVTSPMNITLTSGTLDFSIFRPPTGKINNEGMNHSCSSVTGGQCYAISNDAPATYWAAVPVSWNRVDLGVGVTKSINEVQLQGYGYADRMTNSFKIFGSNNDSDWDELYSGNAVENLNLQTYTFDNASAAYRYYRFNSYSIFGASPLQMLKIRYIENTFYSLSKTGIYNDNEYHFLTAVRRSNNDDLYLFVDGQTVSGTTDPGDYSNASDPLLLGGSPGDYKTITFDEVRSSEVVRSRYWIEATYYSNMDNFITFDSPPTHYYDGYITEEDSPVSRQVRLYYRDTGALMGSTTSSGINGYYYLTTTISGEHFIVAFDDDAGDDYNALVLDKLLPRGIE